MSDSPGAHSVPRLDGGDHAAGRTSRASRWRILFLPAAALVIFAACWYKTTRDYPLQPVARGGAILMPAPIITLPNSESPPEIIRLERYLGRLRVGSLAESHAGTQAVHVRHITRRTMQVGLQDDADISPASGPDLLEGLERALGVFRTLHVEAHETPHLIGPVQHGPEIVPEKALADVLPELGELERDIGVERL